MYARQHERQAMKDALEMAVLTTVSHPNIIQVGGAAWLCCTAAAALVAALLCHLLQVHSHRTHTGHLAK